MTAQTMNGPRKMAKKRTGNQSAEEFADELRGRIDLRVDEEFELRLRRQAKRFTGGNLSAYLRLAATERLEKDEASDPRGRT